LSIGRIPAVSASPPIDQRPNNRKSPLAARRAEA